MLYVRLGLGSLALPAVVGTTVAVGTSGGVASGAIVHPERAFRTRLGLAAAAAANRRTSAPPELVDPVTNERTPLQRNTLFPAPVHHGSVPVALAALVPLGGRAL